MQLWQGRDGYIVPMMQEIFLAATDGGKAFKLPGSRKPGAGKLPPIRCQLY